MPVLIRSKDNHWFELSDEAVKLSQEVQDQMYLHQQQEHTPGDAPRQAFVDLDATKLSLACEALENHAAEENLTADGVDPDDESEEEKPVGRPYSNLLHMSTNWRPNSVLRTK